MCAQSCNWITFGFVDELQWSSLVLLTDCSDLDHALNFLLDLLGILPGSVSCVTPRLEQDMAHLPARWDSLGGDTGAVERISRVLGNVSERLK
jgi:hypothetical protein